MGGSSAPPATASAGEGGRAAGGLPTTRGERMPAPAGAAAGLAGRGDTPPGPPETPRQPGGGGGGPRRTRGVRRRPAWAAARAVRASWGDSTLAPLMPWWQRVSARRRTSHWHWRHLPPLTPDGWRWVSSRLYQRPPRSSTGVCPVI